MHTHPIIGYTSGILHLVTLEYLECLCHCSRDVTIMGLLLFCVALCWMMKALSHTNGLWACLRKPRQLLHRHLLLMGLEFCKSHSESFSWYAPSPLQVEYFPDLEKTVSWASAWKIHWIFEIMGCCFFRDHRRFRERMVPIWKMSLLMGIASITALPYLLEGTSLDDFSYVAQMWSSSDF